MVPFNTPFLGGSVTCGCKADPEQARPRQLGPGQKPPESNRGGNKKTPLHPRLKPPRPLVGCSRVAERRNHQGVNQGHRRESRTLKAQIPVLRKHACQHRFATFAGILVLGAFCPCSKFAQLGTVKYGSSSPSDAIFRCGRPRAALHGRPTDLLALMN